MEIEWPLPQHAESARADGRTDQPPSTDQAKGVPQLPEEVAVGHRVVGHSIQEPLGIFQRGLPDRQEAVDYSDRRQIVAFEAIQDVVEDLFHPVKELTGRVVKRPRRLESISV